MHTSHNGFDLGATSVGGVDGLLFILGDNVGGLLFVLGGSIGGFLADDDGHKG